MADIASLRNRPAQVIPNGFAVVKKGKDKRTGEPVAIKVVDKSRYAAGDNSLEREIQVLLKVDHPNCIRLFDVYITPRKVYIVTELVTGGELLDRVTEKGNYSERDAAQLIRQILRGVSYLHAQGIVHRDLKLENMIMSDERDDADVKIADFGLSKFFSPETVLSTMCGSPQYVAPEVLGVGDGLKEYSPAVDMWSVGVILFILLSGYSPFGELMGAKRDQQAIYQDMDRQQAPSHMLFRIVMHADDDNDAVLFEKIKKGNYDADDPIWENISAEAKDIVAKLLTVDTKKRLTADQALQHPWVQGKVPSSAGLKAVGVGASDKLKAMVAKRDTLRQMTAAAGAASGGQAAEDNGYDPSSYLKPKLFENATARLDAHRVMVKKQTKGNAKQKKGPALKLESGGWLPSSPTSSTWQQQAQPALPGGQYEAHHCHLATWDAVWEVYWDPKWARQRLRLYGAQGRALEQFFKQMEKDMAEVSMERDGRAKQLVVFFGAASNGTGSGWGADAVLRACCEVVCRPRGSDQLRGRVVLVDEHRTTRVSSAVNGQQPCEEELDHEQSTRRADWTPPAGQVDQEAIQPAASEPGPSTPPPAKRSKRTKAEQALEPTQPTKGTGKAQGKAAKAEPGPQPGRWVDRDCNAALHWGEQDTEAMDKQVERLVELRREQQRAPQASEPTNLVQGAIEEAQLITWPTAKKALMDTVLVLAIVSASGSLLFGLNRIGESRWRSLELCWWTDQGVLPAKGKEYPGLGCKRPTKGTGKAQGKAAKAKPAPQPGRWLDRDCNAALSMQRIGESKWRLLELCNWPDQGAPPAMGKEYPGLGYKRLRDKPPKAQQSGDPN
ncbi:hypothetical protein QJQ45_005162 [Haematococcus lacustris]|nr:hypothetical protein QJQ45_005162 [Haematococcus lacustris]